MKTIYALTILLSVVLLYSCSYKAHVPRSSTSEWNYNNPQQGGYQESDLLIGKGNPESEEQKSNTKVEAGSMIIYDATLHLQMKRTDSAQAKITTIAKKYGGYLLNSSPSTVTIRVLSAQLHTACDEIALLGKTEQTFNGRDVSEEYLDLSIRLENADKTRKRYLELLDKAHNVDDALKIERELERLNNTIDQLKGRLQQIDHLVAYSTVTVRVSEKKILGPLSYVGIGVYKVVKFLFVWN
jgi:hypothetical protein